MALKQCSECGREVSTTAAACPNCGAVPRKPGAAVASAAKVVWTAAKLFVGAVVLIVVYQCTQRVSSLGERASASSTVSPTPTESAAPSVLSWVYETRTDPLTSKAVPLGTLRSKNSMSLEFPYQGQNYGHLLVRTNAKGKTDVMFFIDKGQTMCRSYEYNCTLHVRFDDGQAVTFRGVGPSDHSTETAFLDQPAKFVAAARKAKRIVVAMNIYKSGQQVLEFESPEPLRWPPK